MAAVAGVRGIATASGPPRRARSVRMVSKCVPPLGRAVASAYSGVLRYDRKVVPSHAPHRIFASCCSRSSRQHSPCSSICCMPTCAASTTRCSRSWSSATNCAGMDASPRQSRVSRWDKVVLATIVAKYRDLANALVLVKPDAVLRWHRAIVRQKWTYGCPGRLLRPGSNLGMLSTGLPENQAGWSKRPGQPALSPPGHNNPPVGARIPSPRPGQPPSPARPRTAPRRGRRRRRSRQWSPRRPCGRAVNRPYSAAPPRRPAPGPRRGG